MKYHGVYYVTGGLRSGKSLICTRKIQEFLLSGRKVVTNFDLKIENLLPHTIKQINCVRIPDHPTVDDLKAIGQGYDHEDEDNYDESKFGLIVLDELGTWLNSRNWQDKTRRPVIDWLLHSGKLRWNLMLIIQDEELLDNQAKAATANQYIVRCRRLGSYSVPFISPFWKLLTGEPLKLPPGHIANVRVGLDKDAPIADRWLYKGVDLYLAYNTRQIFTARDNPSAKMLSSYLSPWHIAGRFEPVRDWAYWRQFLNERAFLAFVLLVPAFLLGFASMAVAAYSWRQNGVLQAALHDANARINSIPARSEILAGQPVAPAKLEKPDCSAVDALKDLYITGASRRPDGRSYVLSRADSGSLTSGRLVSMGFGVSSDSDCHMTISKGSCKVEITCDVISSRTVAASAGGGGGAISDNKPAGLLEKVFD